VRLGKPADGSLDKNEVSSISESCLFLKGQSFKKVFGMVKYRMVVSVKIKARLLFLYVKITPLKTVVFQTGDSLCKSGFSDLQNVAIKTAASYSGLPQNFAKTHLIVGLSLNQKKI
jgi:hypothetical protein